MPRNEILHQREGLDVLALAGVERCQQESAALVVGMRLERLRDVFDAEPRLAGRHPTLAARLDHGWVADPLCGALEQSQCAIGSAQHQIRTSGKILCRRILRRRTQHRLDGRKRERRLAGVELDGCQQFSCACVPGSLSQQRLEQGGGGHRRRQRMVCKRTEHQILRAPLQPFGRQRRDQVTHLLQRATRLLVPARAFRDQSPEIGSPRLSRRLRPQHFQLHRGIDIPRQIHQQARACHPDVDIIGLQGKRLGVIVDGARKLAPGMPGRSLRVPRCGTGGIQCHRLAGQCQRLVSPALVDQDRRLDSHWLGAAWRKGTRLGKEL